MFLGIWRPYLTKYRAKLCLVPRPLYFGTVNLKDKTNPDLFSVLLTILYLRFQDHIKARRLEARWISRKFLLWTIHFLCPEMFSRGSWRHRHVFQLPLPRQADSRVLLWKILQLIPLLIFNIRGDVPPAITSPSIPEVKLSDLACHTPPRKILRRECVTKSFNESSSSYRFCDDLIIPKITF